jgi:UDP-N-acetylglucosamine--N-acetylmuramyl-(pentapeptide) pyrophosphoryl-undecaprenol N-acetylglucosamine transferase
MKPGLRILLTGGGTGGHVYPALSVVAASARAGEVADYLWIGTVEGMERGIVERAGLPFEPVTAGAIRGRSVTAAVISLLSTLRGTHQALSIIRRWQADVVLATGGFVCVPVVLAAKLAHIPRVIYLPDLRPGWAVRFLARIASAVAVSFDEVCPFIPTRKTYVTGYPVRPEIFDWTPEQGRLVLGVTDGAPVTLVLGGSRGAQSINDAIFQNLESLLEKTWIVHAAGVNNVAGIEKRRAALPPLLQQRYRLYPYLNEELVPALVSATVVVARSGASVLGELPAVGAPGILVPYPHAGGHQRLNASFLAERGAARNGALATAILDLLADNVRRDRMATAVRRLARPAAALDLFHLIGEVASPAGRQAIRRWA